VKFLRIVVVCGICLCIPSVFAQTTRPIRGLDDVESNYQDDMDVAKRDYQAEVQRAAESRLAGLHVLEDRALRNEDIDLASNIRAKIKVVEGGSYDAISFSAKDRQNQMDWLEHKLDGTLWHWGDDFVRFGSDGNVENSGWTSRGLVTKWKVIDTRTVLLTIVHGRSIDLYAILTFDQNANTYAGWGFEKGKPLLMAST
jgi:hypothetical protein